MLLRNESSLAMKSSRKPCQCHRQTRCPVSYLCSMAGVSPERILRLVKAASGTRKQRDRWKDFLTCTWSLPHAWLLQGAKGNIYGLLHMEPQSHEPQKNTRRLPGQIRLSCPVRKGQPLGGMARAGGNQPVGGQPCCGASLNASGPGSARRTSTYLPYNGSVRLPVDHTGRIHERERFPVVCPQPVGKWTSSPGNSRAAFIKKALHSGSCGDGQSQRQKDAIINKTNTFIQIRAGTRASGIHVTQGNLLGRPRRRKSSSGPLTQTLNQTGRDKYIMANVKGRFLGNNNQPLPWRPGKNSRQMISQS